MEQKIIITNNNLLFQFSDHNNNLLALKLWKSARSVIILIRSRSPAIKLYFFSCSMFLSKNFDLSFVLSEYSGLVYTPTQRHVVFSYKLNLLRCNSQKIKI